MATRRFFLRNKQIRAVALEAIQAVELNEDKPMVVELKPLTRSLPQNAKLHAMLTDIAKQGTFNGEKQTLETWKMIFVSGHTIATGGQAGLTLGLEGEIINLRESTANMSVSRMASLIEYITAWGVANGVKFRAYFDEWGK